ncbi:hypothetical protein BJ875DRAFT_497559 [Amylocarpus encephaloides]|uniref:Uncharacterized protein n=1 Tax=Amylocarpus encephaloides TaxID=45428 RepID=A0A9P8C3P9_9HELO|nr:hypothetical protein BJ875DRAFT_497559 [Amylocarpus encephaloides]
MLDRESGELLQVEGEAIEEPCHMFKDYPVSSFNSPNCPPPISQYINPNDALHYPFSHDESIYDIPGDVSYDKPAKNAIKRTSAAAKKGRMVSLGNVSQYADEGDVGCEPQDYEDGKNAHKRRKPLVLPAKQSKARRPPFKVHVIEHDDSSDAVPQEENCQEGTQEPQLTTPPDTSKGGRKKATIPNKKKEQLPVFKNLTITKLVAPPEKASEREDPSSVLSYQGWTATQDAVKSNHVGLAKTTLDKLAAFKYKPSTQAQLANATITFTDNTSQAPEDQLLISRPDGDNTSSGDGFFRHALRNIEAAGQFTNEECPASSLQGPLANLGEVSNAPDEMNDIPRCHDDNEATFTSLLGDEHAATTVPALEDVSIKNQISRSIDPTKFEPQIVVQPSSQPSCNSLEPTSCEARVISNLLDVVEMAREGGESIYDASKRLEMPSLIPQGLQRTASGQNNVQSQICDDRSMEYSKCEAASGTIEDAHAVTRSSEILNDILDDDFDDDLDDADFLAIAIETDLHKDINQNTDVRHKSPPLPKCLNLNTALCNIVKNRDEELLSSSPMLMSSDSDIYPMGTGEENDMLELCQSSESVIERFHAPASIQHSFDDVNDRREVYDSSLQFSPPNPKVSKTSTNMGSTIPANISANHGKRPNLDLDPKLDPVQIEEEDWSFMTSKNQTYADSQTESLSTPTSNSHLKITGSPRDVHIQVNASSPASFLDDSHEYEPLDRFARPEFPELVRDRCPIVGVSSQSFLRVCFRVGEMFREGARCKAAGQDGVIELFARVTFSSREGGTTKQYFQFADLWSDNPPFPTGILLNYKVSGLAESESKVFVGSGKGQMARCLGRLKKERKSNTGWVFYIINIRETDCEEIRWTKRVVSAGTHRENKDLSKLGR